ncbi:hypothetical protein GDN83_06965 [Gordonia jinghuaiqii]|uniref:Uncharacterized protein n=1 Tax=Gordonia jinghuaiqii TaxID=2758710 RepID=A0A7D7R3Q4_9ACTN|nr:hypothetical protein [Gordonia jinghuaiqii]MCR5977481.1 hypothetical protein [Gordonia jinghuaiqii]QMT02172.1 hypothetical protein H1R19_03045 [Gordonia jinghuaiqii]
MKLHSLAGTCFAVMLVTSACGIDNPVPDIARGGDSSGGSNCATYEGPNLTAQEFRAQIVEAHYEREELLRKYKFPGAAEMNSNPESSVDLTIDQVRSEIPNAPAGSFQRHFEFVCEWIAEESSTECALAPDEARGKAAEQIEQMKNDPKNQGIDVVGYAREQNELHNRYLVTFITTPLSTCAQARAAGTTIAGMYSGDGMEVDDNTRFVVESSTIVCPDEAGELPAAPADCGETSLESVSKSGAIRVVAGDVDCDDATKIIRESWTRLLAIEQKIIVYEVDGAEYTCGMAGVGESAEEGYDYKCETAGNDKTITWSAN